MQTNGKRRRHWAGGFTLSEILITLAILGFIAALSVPMLGQQKLKKPNVSALGHGIFECYYDDDGALYQHYADEKGTDKIEAVAGTECHFTAPVANYYAITTIGAGGNGGYMNEIPYYNPDKKSTDPTPVSTGLSFNTDLHNLPSGYDWVLGRQINGQNYWDAAAPYNKVKYTLQARLGKSGSSAAYVVIYTDDKPGCGECLAIGDTNCKESCFTPKDCRGGNSGYAYSFDVKNVQLGSSDNVRYNTNGSKNGHSAVTLNIGNKEAWVYNADDGTDATATATTCKNGDNGPIGYAPYYPPSYGYTGFSSISNVNWNQNYGATSTTGYPQYAPIKGQNAVAAAVSMNPSSIDISYEYLVINPKYGTSGQPGNVIMRIYEKLPKSVLVAVPASNIHDDSVVYIQNANGQRSTLSKAAAGANGTKVNDSKYYEINAPADLPFPPELKEIVAPKTPDIFSAIGCSLNSKIAKLEVTPGTSGYGGYPFIRSISASLNKRIGKRTFYGGNSTINTTEEKCWDGSDPVLGYSGKYYCAATRGGKGAVKIEW